MRVLRLAVLLAVAGVSPVLAMPTATITGGPGFGVPNVAGKPDHPTNATSGTVSFTYSGSGITTVECADYVLPGSPTFGPCTTANSDDVSGTNGQTRRFTLRITDAGNNTITRDYDWAVDTTAPTLATSNLGVITSNATLNHFTLGATATPGLACNDDFSGVAGCVSNSALATDTLDSFERTFTATDRAGNTATPLKRSYRVDPPKYATLVDADNPIGHWTLDDAAVKRPSLLNCQKPGHRPFACVGGNGYVAPAASDSGTSAYFSGDNSDHVRIDNVVAPTGPHSVEMWVEPFDTNDGNLFEDGATAQLSITAGHFVFRHDANAAAVTGTTTISAHTRYHVVGVWDGTDERLYVNGALDGTATPDVLSVATSAEPTVYIGYGRQASAGFHGLIDEVALYGSALSAASIDARWQTGTVTEQQYTYGGSADTTPPSLGDLSIPSANEQFSVAMTPSKIPAVDYSCADPDALGGAITCSGTLPDGTGMTLTPGTHSFTVTAQNAAGLSWTETHTYEVYTGFEQLMRCLPAITGCTAPVAYWRLNEPDAATTMVDASGHGHDGVFFNDQKNGQVGISGDGDTTRWFLGDGGYAAVNGIIEPPLGYTMELWVRPDDTNAMSLMQHGSSGALYIDANSHYAFRPEERSGAITGPAATADGSFHQVAGVWDGVDATLYVDGTPAGSLEAPARPSGSDTLYLGYGTQAPWLRGELDEVSYDDVALSAGKVYEHFLADPPAGDHAPGRAKAPATTTPTTKATTTAKQPAAKAKAKKVAAAKKALAKAKAKLAWLVKHHKNKGAVAHARATVRAKSRALAKLRRA